MSKRCGFLSLESPDSAVIPDGAIDTATAPSNTSLYGYFPNRCGSLQPIRTSRGRMTHMTAQTWFSGVHWIVLSACLLAPTALLAQQGSASQEQAHAVEGQTGVAQEQANATPGQDETAENQSDPAPDQDDTAQDQADGPQIISGMSILGNQEAPTSLVIVPWKSSEIGDSVGVSTLLDDSRQPVDQEVFMRSLSYYQIRAEGQE